MFKHTLTLALSVLGAVGLGAQTNGILRQNLGNGNSLLRLDTSKKILMLPIQDSAPEAKFRLVKGNSEVATFNIRLAQSHIDYVLPMDLRELGEYTGSYLLGVADSAIAWSQLSLQAEAPALAPEPYRPSYHFTPKQGWMNDPNGMFYLNGTYHLYYQANPYGSLWGNLSWGHATSEDLLHWKHHPTALFPDVHGMIFSGSCVVDKENTAGFGANAVVAFYTSAREAQTQSIAYSTDGGYTFTKYEGNPVLTSPKADFRDPKVIWHEPTRRWVMLLAVGHEMQFFTSTNLTDWTYASSFGEGYGAHGGVWECPDLLEMKVAGSDEKKWVLICNLNPGGPSGGSAAQYFVGDFDGRTFSTTSPKELTKWIDYGKDHYAMVSWHNAPQGPKVIAWMSNWEYANAVPTKQFRSAMSLPRTLGLYKQGSEYYVSVSPTETAKSLLGKGKTYGSASLSTKARKYPSAASSSYCVDLQLTPSQAKEITLKLTNEKGEELVIVLDALKHELRVDRTKSGLVNFSDKFASISTSPLPQADLYSLRIFVDSSSVEIFDAAGGRFTQTNLVFPTTPFSEISLQAQGGRAQLKNMTIYPIVDSSPL